jgi:hypothetical protein
MIKWHIISSLLEALSDTPVVLLTGARQTGKSTLVKAIASDYHPARYITLDNLSMLAAVRQNPALLTSYAWEARYPGLSEPVTEYSKAGGSRWSNA